MQVNKYIPHYQRIPNKLKKVDLKRFQKDYYEEPKDDQGLPEELLEPEQRRQRRINPYIIAFDR